MTGLAHIQQPFAVGGDTAALKLDHLQAACQHRSCWLLHSCERHLHKFLPALPFSKEIQHAGRRRRTHAADPGRVRVQLPDVLAFGRDRPHEVAALVIARKHGDAIRGRVPVQPVQPPETLQRYLRGSRAVQRTQSEAGDTLERVRKLRPVRRDRDECAWERPIVGCRRTVRATTLRLTTTRHASTRQPAATRSATTPAG